MADGSARAVLLAVIGPLVVAVALYATSFLVRAALQRRVVQVRRMLMSSVTRGVIPAAHPLTVELLNWCRAVSDGSLHAPPTGGPHRGHHEASDILPSPTPALNDLLREVLAIHAGLLTQETRMRVLPRLVRRLPSLDDPLRRSLRHRCGRHAVLAAFRTRPSHASIAPRAGFAGLAERPRAERHGRHEEPFIIVDLVERKTSHGAHP